MSGLLIPDSSPSMKLFESTLSDFSGSVVEVCVVEEGGVEDRATQNWFAISANRLESIENSCRNSLDMCGGGAVDLANIEWVVSSFVTCCCGKPALAAAKNSAYSRKLEAFIPSVNVGTCMNEFGFVVAVTAEGDFDDVGGLSISGLNVFPPLFIISLKGGGGDPPPPAAALAARI